MTKKQYAPVSYEARVSFNKQIREVEHASLEDRQAARAEWLDVLQNDADTLIERIEWLLDGNYGFGACEVAREVLPNKRMNRPAWLGQCIAAVEWKCPNNFARWAWNQLPENRQVALTALIESVIDQYLAEMDAEETTTES